jgi:hypothetical protein
MPASAPGQPVNAAELAAKLRTLQAQLADAPAADREEALADTLERSLKPLTASDRSVVMRELVELLGGGGHASAQPAGRPGPSAGGSVVAAPAPPRTATNVAAELATLFSKLTKDEQAAVLAQLKDAGVVPSGPTGPALPGPVGILARRALGLTDSAVVDEARLAEAVATMATIVRGLHGYIVPAWERLSPPKDPRPIGKLMLRAYADLAAAQTTDAKAAAKEAEEFRLIALGMVAALAQLGKMVSADIVSRYHPEAVKDGAGQGGLLTDKSVVCWKHYESLWEGRDRDQAKATVERQVNALIVETIWKVRPAAGTRA